MREVAHLDILAVQKIGLLEQMVCLVVDLLVGRQEPPHDVFRRAQTLDCQQHIVEDCELGEDADAQSEDPRSEIRDPRSEVPLRASAYSASPREALPDPRSE